MKGIVASRLRPGFLVLIEDGIDTMLFQAKTRPT